MDWETVLLIVLAGERMMDKALGFMSRRKVKKRTLKAAAKSGPFEVD